MLEISQGDYTVDTMSPKVIDKHPFYMTIPSPEQISSQWCREQKGCDYRITNSVTSGFKNFPIGKESCEGIYRLPRSMHAPTPEFAELYPARASQSHRFRSLSEVLAVRVHSSEANLS